MLVLAHRGYHAEVPENTLAAFDAAIRLGADGIETDVQVSADGVPILFHDRLVGGQEISQLAHVEINRLAGYQVPTLVSALDAWPDIFWNLEIKLPTDLAPIWPVLRVYESKRRLLVSSFWHPVAIRAGRELGLDCGLLVAHRPPSFESLLIGLPDDLPRGRVSVVWEFANVDADLLGSAVAAGVKSYVYGPQTPEEHAQVRAWRVSGVITDHPGWSLMENKMRKDAADNAENAGA